MKNILLILLLGLVLKSNLVAQSALPIYLNLEIQEDSVGKFDIINFQVSIINKNETHESIAIKRPWNDHFLFHGFGKRPLLEFRSVGEEEWLPLKRSNYYNSGVEPLSYSTVNLSFGDSVVSPPLEYVPTYLDSTGFEYYFKKEGQYDVRAYYPFFYLEDVDTMIVDLYSNEVPIWVHRYSGADAEAEEWMDSLEIPHFIFLRPLYIMEFSSQLFSPLERRDYVEKRLPKQANFLAKKFANSKFSAWAMYFMALHHVYLSPRKNGSHREKKKEAIQILKSIETKDEALNSKIDLEIKALELFNF